MRRHVTATTSVIADGDFRIGAPGPDLDARRQALAPGSWTWLRQVHGTRVVTVTAPGEHAGAEADAAVTDVPGAVLAVHSADCVPVVLVAPEDGVVGVAHAGWRGLTDGVLQATVLAMRDLGATGVTATVGPHIRPRCYEFGAADLDQVAEGLGTDVRATTGWGTPALDLFAGVRAALDPLGVTVVDGGGCTACEPQRLYSHRARGDAGRLATTVVLGDGDGTGADAGTVSVGSGMSGGSGRSA